MNSAKLGILAIVALVGLRLAAGWLFYQEGTKKIESQRFNSRGFLADATGPFAGFYQRMIPDIYGLDRMNLDYSKDEWDLFRSRASVHFNFDKDQRRAGQRAFDQAVAQLQYLLAVNEDDIREYFNEAARLEAAQKDRSTRDVSYRNSWMSRKEAELDAELKPWLAEIDSIWNRFERDINSIPTDEQWETYGPLRLRRAGEGPVSSYVVDQIIPWFTTIVGALLVLGLFTRVAAVAGSVFLAGVVASQPPWVAGAADTNYQIVLLVALLAIAAVGAGRWGGMDFFLRACWASCCGTKAQAQGTEINEHHA